MINETIRNKLIDVARMKSVVNYSDIAPLVGLDMSYQPNRTELGNILGEISENEYNEGRPLLSVVVVRASLGYPGEGFFRLADEIGAYNEEDDLAFFSKELQRVYDFWDTSKTIPENHFETIDIHTQDDLLDDEAIFEGAKKQISVNIYERSSDARILCISHYGVTCHICGFNFEDHYGQIGKNFIHVHHLKPLSEIDQEYMIDPIKDLRPVCANCHAIIHRRKPSLSIDEMKTILKYDV